MNAFSDSGFHRRHRQFHGCAQVEYTSVQIENEFFLQHIKFVLYQNNCFYFSLLTIISNVWKQNWNDYSTAIPVLMVQIYLDIPGVKVCVGLGKLAFGDSYSVVFWNFLATMPSKTFISCPSS